MKRNDLLRTVVDRLAPRWSPTMYKATLIGAVAAAIVIPLVLAATPFIEFFNGMAAQPKGKAQMTYGRTFGEARLVTRNPVEGTTPAEESPYSFAHLDNKIETAVRVGERLPNPIPVHRAALERGQDRYTIFCITCHGKTGHGDGPVTGVNPVTGVTRFPKPPSLHSKQALEYRDGTIYHIITMGVGKMPSYADKLTEEDRWRVIHYLRALQRSQNPRPEDLEGQQEGGQS
jgi:mono/diheme cytochrome c family protein